jgi:diguanylate cyclase (GGDEF)-like protein
MATPPRKLLWLQGAVLAIVYFISAKLGLDFSTISENVTLLWPPSGIALFALLVFGARLWPAVFLGALAVNSTTSIAIDTASGIAVGNCLEAVAGFYLLRLAGFQTRLTRIRDVVLLVLLAAGLSTTLSASIGSLTLAYAGVIPWDHAPEAWVTWWMGDAMGDLVFASFLLAWWRGAGERSAPGRRIEAGLLLVTLALVTQLIFGSQLSAHEPPWPLDFMTFPLLTWAALRFGMRGATGATLVIGIIILANIIAGHGPFVRSSALESLILLWLYTNVLAVTGMVLAASVSERVRAEERMRHLAQHDHLTGLPNRISLQAKLDLVMAHAERAGQLVAVLFVDIDRFKVINDTLGHSIGDQLLGQIGSRLRQHLRKEDTLTRHGGDEFVILIEGIRQPEDVAKVAHKLLEALHDPFLIDGARLHVSASIGISFYPNNGRDADTLLKNADTAMYRAKDLGRNTLVFYSSDMNASAGERLTMENELREAIRRNEYILHYQPQYDVLSGRVVGSEALLRWQRGNGQYVMPDEFIPLLEETGLINPVGVWVLDAACAQLAEWQAQGAAGLRMSVNVSSHQLRDAILPRQVAAALTRYSLAPHLLELEITESMLVRQDLVVERNIQQLVELGVRLAVDDFGTGYSSLSYLHRLSIDTLKIDRAFVRNLPSDENSGAIARAIVGLGRSLHLALIAEGIETAAQRDFLSALGCHIMQGYLFSRPVTVAEFSHLILPEKAVDAKAS